MCVTSFDRLLTDCKTLREFKIQLGKNKNENLKVEICFRLLLSFVFVLFTVWVLFIRFFFFCCVWPGHLKGISSHTPHLPHI